MTQDKAASYWGAHYFEQTAIRAEWQSHPLALERLVALLGGRLREDWFAESYLSAGPAKRALGVGVGRAETELELLRKGHVEHFDLYDVSPVGLEFAKQCAEKLGLGDRVRCFVGDIQTANLPEGNYDLVTFMASLHHIAALKPTLRAVNRTLRPGGILWAGNEYIGPDRFNYPATHLSPARGLFLELPAHLKKNWSPVLPLPTPDEVAAADPSESPCSSQIVPTMQRIFPRLEIKPLYGSFAFMIFWGLNHDALYETPEGTELVRFILAMDKALVDGGMLPHYFAHLVAWKATPLQAKVIRLGIPAGGPMFHALQRLRSRLRPG
jgi:SAM-dependent methyltransferase